jgi:DNA-binding GntR family transcriptional regulator
MKNFGVSLSKGSLRHRIAEEIRKAIFEGRLKPGDKITESHLSAETGVSRGPVREAIQLLEQEGLLQSLPYKETRVSSITAEEVEELLIPIRMKIETYALKKGFPFWEESIFVSFRNIIKDMEKAVMYGDLLTLVELDIRFHEIIIKACNLEGTIKVWESIVNRMRLHFIYHGKSAENLNEVVLEHEDLLQKFQSRNLEIANKGLIDHILDSNMKELMMHSKK